MVKKLYVKVKLDPEKVKIENMNERTCLLKSIKRSERRSREGEKHGQYLIPRGMSQLVRFQERRNKYRFGS